MTAARWLVLVCLVVPVVPVWAAPDPFDVEIHKGIPYLDGPGRDAKRHLLDLYVPRGQKDFPVVVFVHGGAWVHGDKNQLGMYAKMGKTLARYGIGMVSPNYRLSPWVKHPEHVRDVARAVAWTRDNIARFGGNPRELFLSGHSAGGHLVSLLTTDERWLREVKMSSADIRGVAPISGVYSVPREKVFDPVFGKGDESRRDASPIAHVRPGLPPFLLLCADNDFPYCGRPHAEDFQRMLQAKGCSAQFCEIPRRNHLTILWNANKDTDPVAQALLSFVMTRVAQDRLARNPEHGLDTARFFLARYLLHAGGN